MSYDYNRAFSFWKNIDAPDAKSTPPQKKDTDKEKQITKKVKETLENQTSSSPAGVGKLKHFFEQKADQERPAEPVRSKKSQEKEPDKSEKAREPDKRQKGPETDKRQTAQSSADLGKLKNFFEQKAIEERPEPASTRKGKEKANVEKEKEKEISEAFDRTVAAAGKNVGKLKSLFEQEGGGSLEQFTVTTNPGKLKIPVAFYEEELFKKEWEQKFEAYLPKDPSSLKRRDWNLLFNSLKEFKMEMDQKLKPNYPQYYERLNQKYEAQMAKLEAGYHEYQESRLVDFGSIEDDLSMIEAKRTSEVQKISPKTEKNISRSYSLFPDGTLYVHLRSEDSIRVGDETKWGSLEGGGYKTPKFMKNVKNEKLGMRLVVKRAVVNSREWQRQRTNILKFMKDIEGEKHLCQMKYIQWEGKPKKLLFGMSSRLKGKSADPTKTFKEAFLCDYYPLCASKIVKTPDITYESAVDFSLQLALTVQTIHKKGWAHRDIKPDNMYVEDGNVILADFDTVHRADDKDASADSERGTPGYSPKEYGLEQPVEDAKPADIYAMGISLMEMYITKGPPPWIDAEDSPMQKTYALSTSKYPEGLQQLRESAKTPLEHLILDMCDPDPEKRPKIDEVVSKLQALKA